VIRKIVGHARGSTDAAVETTINRYELSITGADIDSFGWLSSRRSVIGGRSLME
jgi:hypothetical protein